MWLALYFFVQCCSIYICMYISHMVLLFLRFHLLIVRERGREGEKDGEKH